jgi:hypothetical protein
MTREKEKTRAVEEDKRKEDDALLLGFWPAPTPEGMGRR